jgi:hypothetical protein
MLQINDMSSTSRTGNGDEIQRMSKQGKKKRKAIDVTGCRRPIGL